MPICTIISVSKAFFNANSAAVLDQIRSDSIYNDDGYGLVTMGLGSTDATVLKAKDADAVVAALCFLDWERAWVHCRASTTTNETLDDCHPFVAHQGNKAWFVMHNGILSGYGADNWRVDSKLITDIIGQFGINAAISHLLEHQSFANVFIICPESGLWYVSRSSGGRLHTDGAGNYSTNTIGAINQPVPSSFIEIYQEQVTQPSLSGRWSGHSGLSSGSSAHHYSPKHGGTKSADPTPSYREDFLKESEDKLGLPEELKSKANDYLTDNYEEINSAWDDYCLIKYNRN